MISFMLDYSKTSSMTRSDKTVFRYLPRRIGNLFIKFILLVRPFQSFIYVGQSKAAGLEDGEIVAGVDRLLLYFACCSNSTLLTGTKYSENFKSIAKSFGNHFISVILFYSYPISNYQSINL
jgi:hypothetical protein